MKRMDVSNEKDVFVHDDDKKMIDKQVGQGLKEVFVTAFTLLEGQR